MSMAGALAGADGVSVSFSEFTRIACPEVERVVFIDGRVVSAESGEFSQWRVRQMTLSPRLGGGPGSVDDKRLDREAVEAFRVSALNKYGVGVEPILISNGLGRVGDSAEGVVLTGRKITQVVLDLKCEFKKERVRAIFDEAMRRMSPYLVETDAGPDTPNERLLLEYITQRFSKDNVFDSILTRDTDVCVRACVGYIRDYIDSQIQDLSAKNAERASRLREMFNKLSREFDGLSSGGLHIAGSPVPGKLPVFLPIRPGA